MIFFFGVKKEPKKLWGDADPKPRRPWRSGAMRLIRRVKAKFAITLGFNENFNKSLAKKHLEVCS